MAALIILIALLLLAGLLLLFFNPNSQKNKAFHEAIASYDNNLHAEALLKFQDLLNDEPYNALYHWYVALCALQRKNYTTATNHLEYILQIRNFNVPGENLPDIQNFNEIGVHTKLVEIYETLKIRQKILAQYERLTDLDPQNDTYPLKIAQFHIEDKTYSDEVQGYLEKALHLNPQNATAQFLLSLVYYKNDDFEKALQSAEKTIALDRSINDAHYIMGYARYRLNLKDEAEKHFRNATLCRYFKKSTAFYLAKVIASSGKIGFALPYAAEANSAAPSLHEPPTLELEAMYFYANLLEESNSYDEAIALYKNIQRIQPDYQDVSRRLKYMSPLNPDQKKTESTVNLIEVFKKMKNEDFLHTSEKVLENMGYKVKKIDMINENNVNMLAYHSEEISDLPTGVFIRRGIGIIQEDLIKTIEHFMSGMQASAGILITPNDFNPAARKLAEKKNIKTINGEQLVVLLKTAIK